MGWNGFISVLFMFLLIGDVSSFSFDLNARKLLASNPVNDPAPARVESSVVVSASPNVTALSPSTSNQTSNKSNNEKDHKKKLSPPQQEENDKKADFPPPEEIVKKSSPTEGKQIDKKVSPPQANEIDKKSGPSAGVLENCDGKEKCQILDTFTGCIHNFESDAKVLEILLQNAGKETLEVNLTVPTSATDDKRDIVVYQGQVIKVNISNVIGKASKILLSTGKKSCEIDIGSPLPEGNTFFHLPTTEQLLTPVNGAYFLLLTVVTFGGVWACCNLTRRRHGSVPYQELEMATPETVSSAIVETAEGWDQGWDDDWDEQNSVKSPVVRLHTGNISANGLTSRPANKDG